MFGLHTVEYIGWILFLISLLIYWIEYKRHINFRMSLCTYSKRLLLDEIIRKEHKTKFIRCLNQLKNVEDHDLYIATDRAIEDMAMYMWEEGSLLAVQKQMKEYTKI